MVRLAEGKRYEDAATVRDRHDSLGRAIEHRRAWQALMGAGTVWAADENGDGVVVRHGHLIASWNAGSSLPLVAMEDPAESILQVPESVATAEEVHLIWRWLNRDGVRIIQSTAPLALPIHPVPTLA
jgi:DNA polymerase-3 subunit epsilon